MLNCPFLSAQLRRLDRQKSGIIEGFLPVLFTRKRQASASELCRRRRPYLQSEMEENKSVLQILQVLLSVWIMVQ